MANKNDKALYIMNTIVDRIGVEKVIWVTCCSFVGLGVGSIIGISTMNFIKIDKVEGDK